MITKYIRTHDLVTRPLVEPTGQSGWAEGSSCWWFVLKVNLLGSIPCSWVEEAKHWNNCFKLFHCLERELAEQWNPFMRIFFSSFDHNLNDIWCNLNINYSLNWKRSCRWLECWEGLLFANDVSTTCAEAIFRVKWRHTLTDYLTKRLTILHTKRLRCEPWREEHKLFSTHTTVWPTKPSTWTLFLLRTTTTQTSSNAILTSDRTTALTTHTPLQPLYLTYEEPPKP